VKVLPNYPFYRACIEVWTKGLKTDFFSNLLMSGVTKLFLMTFAGLSLLSIFQLWLYITAVHILKAQIVEIEEPTGNLTEGTLVKIDLEEPLPPNGTIIVDIMGIDDINIDGVPPLGMTILVQNDTVILTDENVVISNDMVSGEEAGNDDNGEE
jgi:hypothetical protein